MSAIDPRRIATASQSDVGRVRDHNEDSCGEFEDASGQRLLVVADGMGGHKGGATASRVAVEAIGEVFTRSTSDPPTTLQTALLTANQRVHELSLQNPELRGMGTTAVVLMVDSEGRGWVAHVGDSRAYRLRNGKIEPLTADHSVVGEMLRQGLITEADAAVHPRRNEILRSVGVEANVRPDVASVDLVEGDRFLLCSDGLSGVMEADEMAAVLQREPPRQAVGTLIDAANQRGAPDNVTVQVVAIPGGATTEIGEAGPALDRVERALQREARERRIRRAAGFTALVAGVLAAVLLWLVFGGMLDTSQGIDLDPSPAPAGTTPGED
ncbi:MAG: Stp1/IreP family PP2C-type Ser/Thr phosphatase [Myxococcota bacterium]